MGGALFPDLFYDSSRNYARQDADDAYDNFRLMIFHPSSETDSSGIAQVDDAVRTDEVVDDNSREKNAGYEAIRFIDGDRFRGLGHEHPQRECEKAQACE